MSDYINACPKCHYTARLKVFAGEIGIRAVECTKCKFQGPEEKSSKEAIKKWNLLK